VNHARQVHHGHFLLPTCNLGWSAAQWQAAHTAMYHENVQTMRRLQECPALEPALGLLQRQQEALAKLLEATQPAELRADDVRLLVAGLRRADRMDLAQQLVGLYNTTPGVVRLFTAHSR
jgi:hypothetical protein